MCAGAILVSRVGTVVYGARNSLLGADGSWTSLFPISNATDVQPGSCKGALAVWPEKPHPTHPDLQVSVAVYLLIAQQVALTMGMCTIFMASLGSSRARWGYRSCKLHMTATSSHVTMYDQ